MNVRVTKANGFTLIEALIATVVSVIILGAVVGVFKSTSDTNRVTLLRADVQQDARGALNLINRDLSQASAGVPPSGRSEEHTSELQSHLNLVCRLLLEKKNKTKTTGIAPYV